MNNYIRAMHRTTRCRHLLFTEQAELTTELFYVRSQSDEFRVMNYEAMVCLVTASVANSVQGCLDTLLWGNDKSTLRLFE